jgi:hypothetical protein
MKSNHPLDLQSESDLISAVLFVLDDRLATTERLFPGAQPEYASEWHHRAPFDYWGHLDTSHRVAVILLAEERLTQDRALRLYHEERARNS